MDYKRCGEVIGKGVGYVVAGITIAVTIYMVGYLTHVVQKLFMMGYNKFIK